MWRLVKTKAEAQAETKDVLVAVAVEDAQMATLNHAAKDVLAAILNRQVIEATEEVQMLQDQDAQKKVLVQTDATDVLALLKNQVILVSQDQDSREDRGGKREA